MLSRSCRQSARGKPGKPARIGGGKGESYGGVDSADGTANLGQPPYTPPKPDYEGPSIVIETY